MIIIIALFNIISTIILLITIILTLLRFLLLLILIRQGRQVLIALRLILRGAIRTTWLLVVVL